MSYSTSICLSNNSSIETGSSFIPEKILPSTFTATGSTTVLTGFTNLLFVTTNKAVAPTTSISKIRNLNFSYALTDELAVQDFNLDVNPGDFLVLCGPSGCGKSTLLNIIGGLIPADSGSVKFEDLELVGLDDKGLTKYRRDNIGFIFQQYNLMNNLTAVENIRLIAELVKEPMPENDALKLVKMVEKKDSYPSQLSGGQQQRISIARALVKKPKLLIADEPTAALDYETSIEVLSAFEDVLKTGTTLIMVTHNEEIAKMADRVIRFKNGQIYETSINLHPLKAEKLVW